MSVDRVKRRPVLLNIVADRIDDRNRPFHRLGNRRFVPYVGIHELDSTVGIKLMEEGYALGVADGYAYVDPLGSQVLYDLAPEEA